ncbi:MAG: hypothetical protein D6814_00110, partial [Calditrichaeota bacterium]
GHYREEDETRPINFYGRAKSAAEEGVLREAPDALIARIALVYGLPIENGRGRSFLNWVLGRLENGQKVSLFYDQYRTPVEVQELAQAILTVAQSGYSGIVHFAGSERVDRWTFGRYVAEVFGFDEALLQRVSLKSSQSKARRPVDLSLNTDLLVRLIGHPLSGCKAGLEKVRAFARLHQTVA